MGKDTSWGKRLSDIAGILKSQKQANRERRKERLDQGLDRIGNRLGLHSDRTLESERVEAACMVQPTASIVRNIYYAPDMDGHAEPGEVVWIKVSAFTSDRALLVVGHGIQTILGLLISSNPAHASDPSWMDIGSGPWQPTGEPCWLRMDRVVEVPELAIRREGAIVPRRRFEMIASRLRADYGWG